MSAGQQAATELRRLLAVEEAAPEIRAQRLLGQPVPSEQAFDAVRRYAMTLCPLPPREGCRVGWLRAVWTARQRYGRDFARTYLGRG